MGLFALITLLPGAVALGVLVLGAVLLRCGFYVLFERRIKTWRKALRQVPRLVPRN